MARARWFLFESKVDAPLRDGRPQRGVIGAHLCMQPSEPPAVPLCGAKDAVHMPDAQAGSGFMLACIACLAYSEVQP